MTILIQLPNNASTSKYPKTFPQPLNLLSYLTKEDELIDLALMCYKKKKEEIFEILDKCADHVNISEEDIIVNAGDYPPDAYYNEYYNYFFDKMRKPYTAIGTYSKLYYDQLSKRYKNFRFSSAHSDFAGYDLFDFKKYPKVDGKYKACVRVSWGCPRRCKMCPVPLYFDNKFYFYDLNYSLENVLKLYNRGVRYITFIDDNLSISPQFVKLLIKIRQLKLKGLVFHCQEGFDVESFTPKLARLLKALKFDDIKVALENIVPHVIESIEKTHINQESIQNVIDVTNEFDLDVKAFFLMGLDETREEIMDNLKFFAENEFTIRANIVRDYGNNFLDTVDRKLTQKELTDLKSLAYASSFFTEKGVNIFKGFKQLEEKEYTYDGTDTITGKTKFGFQTSRFEKGIKFMFGRGIISNDGKKIVLEQIDPIDATGFSADALKKSREIRKKFLDRYGINGKVPTSILLHNRKESKYETIDLSLDERGGGYYHHYRKNIAKMAKKDDYTPGLEKSGLQTQGRKDYLSSFPQSAGRVIVDLYCPEGGTVYDPFAGHNSRMQLCFRLGRNYIGVDISHDFMEKNRMIRDILYERRKNSLNIHKHNNKITLIEDSSDNTALDKESADFTITSPPYWDLEFYGDEPKQLGKAKTYGAFRRDLFLHVLENYRVLKSGAYCAWFINDFRKNKIFYPYHIDIYNLMIEADFIPFNIYIVDLGQTVNQMFVQDIINHKILPKQHEYCILMKKP